MLFVCSKSFCKNNKKKQKKKKNEQTWNCPNSLILLYYLAKNALVIFSSFEQVKNFFGRNSVTYGTPYHAIGHLFWYCECYRFETAFFTLRLFLPCTPSYSFQGFPGAGWHFNFKVSRDLCSSWKYSPSPAICLNHNNPQKRNIYSLQRAGYVKNLFLMGFELCHYK